jgi:catechol 2,3-dioxygenase-like lactoylglutathione lyase family enzyme
VSAELVSVRYLVDDVEESIDYYTAHLGFDVVTAYPPAFAEIRRGNLRLLLSGPTSSAGRVMTDGAKPGPGGWNRIHLIVEDLEREIARLRPEGVTFRNEVVTGPGGAQVLVSDPSRNLIELFQPAEPTRASTP